MPLLSVNCFYFPVHLLPSYANYSTPAIKASSYPSFSREFQGSISCPLPFILPSLSIIIFAYITCTIYHHSSFVLSSLSVVIYIAFTFCHLPLLTCVASTLLIETLSKKVPSRRQRFTSISLHSSLPSYPHLFDPSLLSPIILSLCCSLINSSPSPCHSSSLIHYSTQPSIYRLAPFFSLHHSISIHLSTFFCLFTLLHPLHPFTPLIVVHPITSASHHPLY